jgi:phospholipase/carboxylesterase
MPSRLDMEALAQRRTLDAQATLDRFPGLGHGIDIRVPDRIVECLRD